MGFWGKFFVQRQKKKEYSVPATVLTDIELFDKEFLDATARYTSRPGEDMNMRFRSEDTNEIIPFALAFPQQFEEWKKVQSIWDRRGIIYKILDKRIGDSLKLWQQVERFNIDRYPGLALQCAEEYARPADLTDANFHLAVARAYFILTRYKEAEERAEKAIQLTPNHPRAKVLLGDICHYTHKLQRAHELYNEVLKIKLPTATPMSIKVNDLVGFHRDIIHSPVYAVAMLKASPDADEAVWDALAGEFYHYPQFRSAHATFLLQKGEHHKGFTKLLVLSQEMPWCKEAVINSYSLMQQLGLEPQMKEDKVRLEGILRKEHWTV